MLIRFAYGLLMAMALTGYACGNASPEQQASDDQELRILGPREVGPDGDTIYHRIEDFAFVDQDSNLVTEATVDDKVYVVDFFFTTCPSICPKMSQQMVRLHDAFIADTNVVLLSHTLDPEYDSVAVLKRYAEGLGVKSNKWHLVTGPEDSIYHMALKNYMVAAVQDESAPGGVMHSGAFVLVDRDRHIRGYYDGTQPAEVDRLMKDLRRLVDQ